MRKQTRSSHALAIKRQTPNFDIGVNSNNSIDNNNKRGNSAKGYSLLPLALRPRLFDSEKIASSLAIISIIVASFIISQLANSNNVSATSITLTLPDNGIKLDIKPSASSAFTKSSASTYSVKSDAPFGYTLSIKAKDSTNGNSLINSSNSTAKLTSISNATSEASFSSSGANNTWGYLPSKLNSSDNTNFQPGPNNSTDTILDKTSTANSNTNNDYTIVLGAKVDSNTIAGNYTNTFIMSATANSVSYNITYNLNDGSWSGTSPQSGTTTANTVTLDTHTPTRSNHTFEGWCSTTVANNSGTNPTCSGTKYSVGGTYTLTGATNNLSLYAMWKQNVTYRSYTINYYSNVGSPSNMPGRQAGSASSANNYYDNISWNTPSLTGYTFRGWCINSTNTGSCSSTSYQPGNSIYIPSNGYNISLYAMWEEATPPSTCSGWIPDSPNAMFGGKRWTTTDVTCNWTDANKVCPAGYHLPSKSEFETLLKSYNNGKDGSLYNAGWNGSMSSAGYWSSTPYHSSSQYGNTAYWLSVNTTRALIYDEWAFNDGLNTLYNVRCTTY